MNVVIGVWQWKNLEPRAENLNNKRLSMANLHINSPEARLTKVWSLTISLIYLAVNGE